MNKKTPEERMSLLLRVLDDIIKDCAADEIDSAPDSDAIQKYWREFCTIYEDPDFRHSYSMISSALSEYDPAQRDSLPIYLDRIVCFSEMQPDQEVVSRITKSLRKLQDHIELEGIRLNRMSQIEFLADQARNMQNESIALNKKTEDAAKQLESRVTGFHEQSITILGIFSSVVLTFTAGIAFSTSVLNNISQVSIYRLIGTALVIGLVWINILFGMFHFTGKLVKNDISLVPFWISNSIFIVLLIAVVAAWLFGCVEQRNSRIEGQSIPSSSVVAVTSSSFESKEPEIDQLSEQ